MHGLHWTTWLIEIYMIVWVSDVLLNGMHDIFLMGLVDLRGLQLYYTYNYSP